MTLNDLDKFIFAQTLSFHIQRKQITEKELRKRKEAISESWGRMTYIFDFTGVITSDYWNLTSNQIRMFQLKQGRKEDR